MVVGKRLEFLPQISSQRNSLTDFGCESSRVPLNECIWNIAPRPHTKIISSSKSSTGEIYSIFSNHENFFVRSTQNDKCLEFADIWK